MYSAAAFDCISTLVKSGRTDVTTATTYSLFGWISSASGTELIKTRGDIATIEIYAELAHL